jgi:preprotein translocase subunit SecF
MGRFNRLGNDLYNGHRSIDFIGRWKTWFAASAVILLLALGGLFFRGLNLGIDFVGGTEYNVSLPSAKVTQTNADKLRDVVAGLGIKDAEQPIVTTSGNEAILVQTEPLTNAEIIKVKAAIGEALDIPADDVSQSSLGKSWGKDVLDRAILGLVVFLIVVMLFIWAYFREWKMSVAAIVALAHDVLITVGIYALSGFEVSPATVTGILTILGFSLYDTVVVFDKVRENTHQGKAGSRTYADGANLAVNQTLVRSINTSIVALLPVAALLYVGVVQLGSGSLKDLALALFVGMIAGAYSSIFIATPLLVMLKKNDEDVEVVNRRAAARIKAADPYASVPSFAEGMPVFADPTTTALEQARQHIDPNAPQRPMTQDRLPKGFLKGQDETPDELDER